MTSLPDIERAVKQLTERQLAEFRAWFERFDAEQWDAQLERDVAEGRLDRSAREATDDLKHGRGTDL